jgi:hypothetical protein
MKRTTKIHLSVLGWLKRRGMNPHWVEHHIQRKCQKAINRITRLSQTVQEKIETGEAELECYDPEGAGRLSVALSDVNKLEEYAVRVIRSLSP